MINFGDDQVFIENYQRLKSSRKMGELYGCDKKSITTHARKIGYDYTNNKKRIITLIPVEEVWQEYLSTQSLKEVGKKYHCSGTAVSNYLKSNGYEIINFQAKLSNISDEEFIKLYNSLGSSEKVGQILGCSGTAVLNHAHKINYDVSKSKQYKLSEQDKNEIISAYSTSITSKELSKKYNVSRGMITKLWYDNNLKGKPKLEPQVQNLEGLKFGCWTVLEKTSKRDIGGNICWLCQCDCGIIKSVSGASLKNGTSLSCGSHNNISRGNEKIKQLLTENNILFETEKKFPSCFDKKPMPFDFYVNNEYLIEYDGIQHFKKNNFFNYDYTSYHDKLKSEWCKKNQIPLIRIPYTHFKELTIDDLKLDTSLFIEKYNADIKSDKIGETHQIFKGNTEVNNEIAKGSLSPQSIGGE